MAAWRSDCRRDSRGSDRSEEPRLCRHRRCSVAERALRGCGRGDSLCNFRHMPADLDGTELGPGGGRRKCRRDRRHHRSAGRRLVRCWTDPRIGPTIPGLGDTPDGMDRPVPIPCGGDWLPLRCGDRCRHRRASQNHRYRRHRLEFVPGALVLARCSRRDRHGDRGRWGGRPRRRLRAATRRSASTGCARPRGRRAARLLPLGPRRARGRARRRRAPRPAVVRASGPDADVGPRRHSRRLPP